MKENFLYSEFDEYISCYSTQELTEHRKECCSEQENSILRDKETHCDECNETFSTPVQLKVI